MKNQVLSVNRAAQILVMSLAAVTLVSGCASSMTRSSSQSNFSQLTLPDAVKVPDGHVVMLETIGSGEITYECKARAVAATNPSASAGFEWVFVGPAAKLTDRNGKTMGKYFGPPATWESLDGSKVTGAQVAIAPASAGNIPLQLVKANPAQGSGQMVGVSYIQRVATRGGVAPSAVCEAARLGQRSIVPYQSDYIFWAPNSK
jgi:hypothetical protein